MARLTADQRRKLPLSSFLMPKERALPVHDRTHWRAASMGITTKEGLSESERESLRKKWRAWGMAKGWLEDGD